MNPYINILTWLFQKGCKDVTVSPAIQQIKVNIRENQELKSPIHILYNGDEQHMDNKVHIFSDIWNMHGHYIPCYCRESMGGCVSLWNSIGIVVDGIPVDQYRATKK